jgi:hypothetical protein
MGMLHQCIYLVTDSRDDMLVAHLAEHVECCHHFEVVFALKVLLDCSNHQDDQVTFTVDKKRASKVPDALNE